MFAEVHCHHTGVCVKGGCTCVLVHDPAGLFYDQGRPLSFCSAVGVGARRDRKWGVREPEEPNEPPASLAWETEGDMASVTEMQFLEQGGGQPETVIRWLGCPGLL